MKRILLLAALAFPGLLWAQQNENNNKEEAERIIITKKGADKEKLNIIVDGEKITVNGKAVEEGDEGDITVKRLKIKDLNTFNWSPNAGFDDEKGAINRNFRIMQAPNKAMLGVITEKDEQGAKVVNVNEETAAKKAGLQEGDIITEVDSKKIENPDELSQALKDKKPGDKITIVYLRDGKSQTTTAELTKWSAPQTFMFRGNGKENFSAPNIDFDDIFSRIPQNRNWYGTPEIAYPQKAPKLGIKVQDVEKTDGAKVVEVASNSDADKAGLKVNDIIKSINGIKISGVDELASIIKRNGSTPSMTFKIDRNGKSHNINVLVRKKLKTAEL